MVSCIMHAPVEVVLKVVESLGVEDFYSLKATGKHMYLMLNNNKFAQVILQNAIPYSEATAVAGQGVISFNKALSRVHLTQEALALGRPFSVLTLGYGTSFVYKQGVLCYLCGNSVRVLNVHAAETFERIIDARGLAPRVGRRPIRITKVVHYHDEILSLEYDADIGRRLLCIDLSSSAHPAESNQEAHPQPFLARVLVLTASKFFVRNQSKYIIHGELYTPRPNAHHEWYLTGIDIATGVSSQYVRLLTNFFGSDIGQNVCFEIFDGYLYAVSSQSSREVEEIDWSSFYHCYRVPINNLDVSRLQHRRVWRRQHREGPINDAFTDLSLQIDVRTGAVTIVEARQEFLYGQSEQTRSWYFHRIDFDKVEDNSVIYNVSNAPVAIPHSVPVPASLTNGLYPPNDVLVRALDSTNKPQYQASEPRTGHDVHVDPKHDEHGAPRRKRRPSQVRYRTYNLATSTSLDLLYDDDCCINYQPQLRLQHGSRAPASPLNSATGRLSHPIYDKGRPIPNGTDCFQARPIKMWPHANAPAELFEFLNPNVFSSLQEKVKASADGSSLVYMSGFKHNATGQAIVLVNFDPAIQFRYLPKMDMRTTIQPTKSMELGAMNAMKSRYASAQSVAGAWVSRIVPGVPGQTPPWYSEETAWWMLMGNGYELIH